MPARLEAEVSGHRCRKGGVNAFLKGGSIAGMKIAVGHRPKSDQIPSVAACFFQ